jgi:hypothetical protein
MLTVARKIFGTANDRRLKPLRARVNRINALEPIMEALSDQSLKGKTAEFRERLAKGATLDDLLEESFAVVRETARRVLGNMRHYDVQLVGGMILHKGGIAEMRHRRRQDPGRHRPCLSERARRQGRPRHHRQRLPRPAATPTGWDRSTGSSA